MPERKALPLGNRSIRGVAKSGFSGGLHEVARNDQPQFIGFCGMQFVLPPRPSGKD